MFPAKYRRVIFDDQVDGVLKEVCLEIERLYQIKFIEIGVDADHVHFLVQLVPTAVMNYSDGVVPFTRIHEFRHFHDERRHYPENQTVICREFSRRARRNEDTYYPINTPEDKKILNHYVDAAAVHSHVIFGGRLGPYQYLDMDKAISSALYTYEYKIKQPLMKQKT